MPVTIPSGSQTVETELTVQVTVSAPVPATGAVDIYNNNSYIGTATLAPATGGLVYLFTYTAAIAEFDMLHFLRSRVMRMQ